MDPQIITNVLLQVPALGVVVYLVIHFLAYLRSFREDERNFVKALVEDQAAVMVECRKALHEASETNTQVRMGMEQHLARCPLPTTPNSVNERD